MADFESGKDHLEQLIQSEATGSSRNEAEVRFHLIDPLLNDVLGWPRKTIRVERAHDGVYSDYECGSPPQLVVEAKREGHYFRLPIGWSKPIGKLKTVADGSREAKDAIEQVLRYAQQRGIRNAAICNGTQLIAFLGSRNDGTPPEEGKAVIFTSLEDMLERFEDLWDHLSPPAIAAGRLAAAVSANVLTPPPEKLSSRLLDYPGHKNRNPTAASLQILGGLFIEDLASAPELEEEFLRETYCNSNALSQYALVSKQLLRARFSSVFSSEEGVSQQAVTTKKGLAPEVLGDVLAAGMSKRPILLVGDIGAGKSTFIRHLIAVDAKSELKRALVFYLDFGSKPTIASDLRRFIASEITRQAKSKHSLDFNSLANLQSIYRSELKAFERGIYSNIRESSPHLYKEKEAQQLEALTEDQDSHLGRCLRHSQKNERRQIVIFLDNIDQRPPGFQEDAFLIAQSMAQSWPVTVFVSLRPETFSSSRQSGTLAAYQPRVFTIEPARVDQVVHKRLVYARSKLDKTGAIPGMPQGVQVDSRNLKAFIDVLIRAFSENHDVMEFLDNMSAGNLRTALDYVTQFIGSGHVDSRKILEIEEESYYTLPLHEFLRAIIHRDGEHYDPTGSTIVNALDLSSADGREHFLLPIILCYVDRASQIGGADGYVTRDSVYALAQELGFQVEQSRSAVTRCVEKHLLATPSGSRSDDHSKLRITTAGAYTAKKMIGMFTYLDAMIVDVPIIDRQTRAVIGHEKHIDGRLSRALTFLDYLDSQWEGVAEVADDLFEWPRISSSVRAEIGLIQNGVERTRSRRSPR